MLILSLPKVKQIVSVNTCNSKILDVLLTNMWEYHTVPVIVPPVPCDDPSKGVPSDHSTVVAHPLSTNHNIKNVYTEKIAQPLPDSGMRQFRQWIVGEDWSSIPDNVSTTEQVSKFQEIVGSKLDQIFPKKRFRITQKDKPYITHELKPLDRRKKREYSKHGNSIKFKALKEEFETKLVKAAKNHLEVAHPGSLWDTTLHLCVSKNRLITYENVH